MYTFGELVDVTRKEFFEDGQIVRVDDDLVFVTPFTAALKLLSNCSSAEVATVLDDIARHYGDKPRVPAGVLDHGEMEIFDATRRLLAGAAHRILELELEVKLELTRRTHVASERAPFVMI